MLLAALLLLVSLPLILLRLKELLKNRYLWMITAFCLWVAVCAVIGVARGNDRAVLLSDVKGFCYFAIFPAILCLLNSRPRLLILMRISVYCCAVLAMSHIAVLVVYLRDKVMYNTLFGLGLQWNIAALGSITDSIPRIFFKSILYLLGGCGFSMYLYTKDKKNLLYPVITGICLFALLISYTRSIYGGVVIAAIICLAALLIGATKRQRRRVVGFLVVSVFTFSLITGTFSVIRNANYFGFAIDRSFITLVNPQASTDASAATTVSDATDPSSPTTSSDPSISTAPSEPSLSTDPSATPGLSEPTETVNTSVPPKDSEPTDPSSSNKPTGPSQNEIEKEQENKYLQITQESDVIRQQTLAEHMEAIKQSPIWGHGLGNSVDFRLGLDGGLSEYFYLDLWAKTGVIGVILYVIPVLYALYSFLRRKTEVYAWIWMGVLLGAMAVSFFNPYMNASLGIILYCCAMAAFGLSQCSQTNHNLTR